MNTFVSRTAVSMSPFPANCLQGVADSALDRGRRQALTVPTSFAQQLTHVGKLRGLFGVRQLPWRNDFADHMPAKRDLDAIRPR
jgi:hypothetical protein